MNEIISYKMCAVKVRNAKLRNYLKLLGHLNGWGNAFRAWNRSNHAFASV
jgi:hypothetical protein